METILVMFIDICCIPHLAWKKVVKTSIAVELSDWLFSWVGDLRTSFVDVTNFFTISSAFEAQSYVVIENFFWDPISCHTAWDPFPLIRNLKMALFKPDSLVEKSRTISSTPSTSLLSSSQKMQILATPVTSWIVLFPHKEFSYFQIF